MKNQIFPVFGYIYKITNLVNQKIYIGQRIKPIEKRFTGHKGASRRENPKMPIIRAMKQYGEENFKCELIICALSKDELNYLEKFYIHFYDSFCYTGKGYNLAEGGQFGHARKGFTKEENLEYRKKLSQAHKGRVNINNGIICKVVWPEEVDIYLNEGWVLGMGDAIHYDASEKTKQSWETRKRNRTDVRSVEANQKTSNTLNNKSQEEKDASNEKRKITFRNKTQEQKDKISHRGCIWINNGIKCKKIHKEELIDYVNLGWSLGRKIGETTYINKNEVTKKIYISELGFYISEGWVLGSLSSNKNKIWVCNKEKSKLISKNELDNYLSNGWILGRK